MVKIYKSQKVEKALLKKGFIKEPNDHNYFFLYVDGRRTSVRTHTSHNGQEINKHLFHCMRKQVHLDAKNFSKLIECPLSKEEYVEILKKDDVIKIE